MVYKSKNMNYIFNVEYFRDIITMDSLEEDEIKRRNEAICNFAFTEADLPLTKCKEMEEFKYFSLYTLYPGLLLGIGNPHSLKKEGAIKLGFTFDYVTGLPYITGSTLKGMIRSCFPGDVKDEERDREFSSIVRGILKKDDLNVLALKENMFENNDVFLGAYPVIKKDNTNTLMDMEFITPHKQKFKNPNPISLIKVKPDVEFCFSFLFTDYTESGMMIVSAEEKSNLCKELILLMGIGAKTNVGFGRFSEERPAKNILAPRLQNTLKHSNNQNQNSEIIHNDFKNDNINSQCVGAPNCATPGCKNKVAYNNAKNVYYKYCRECSMKYRNRS